MIWKIIIIRKVNSIMAEVMSFNDEIKMRLVQRLGNQDDVMDCPKAPVIKPLNFYGK